MKYPNIDMNLIWHNFVYPNQEFEKTTVQNEETIYNSKC